LGDELGQNKKNQKDVARIEKAWGRKNRKKKDYIKARNVDHYLVTFECDDCIFQKLKKSDPISRNPQDKLLLACIGRMNEFGRVLEQSRGYGERKQGQASRQT
jgi:hypothetical protein